MQNEVILKIEACIKEKDKCILAIDGRAAAGKTTLANLLQEYFDGAVIHMDDFFLPLELRTKERYATPGGNVHYERFNEEVGSQLTIGYAFKYQRFNCKKMQLDTWQEVENKKVMIVEGTYATHPEIQVAYDMKLFLDINKKEQKSRILHRNGEKMLEQFLSKWIPLEELYFESYSVMEHCHRVLT
ncbi:MAG: uridine kinase [Zhenhengia sp.]|jgi:uridine kinase|uniref:uridine kinase family protein n=1 Tax=Zhenhengia sp. TaxID=2944208 RepID=UPI00290DB69B|nr:uridine kinase [Clostridiales bacterium]MDU6975513.1 uridine kinase [Clostridiales bacterium]